MKIKSVSLIVTFLASLAPPVCLSQEFSADVVHLPVAKIGVASISSGGTIPKASRIYVSNEKMRLETHGPSGTILVVNGAEHTAFAIVPATKEYEPLAGGPPEYFRAVDAENACPDWQKAAVEKIDCQKVGHEMVNGRQMVKYKNNSMSEDSISAIWIDLRLRYVMKWETANASVEMHNIQEGQQPPELFALPPDYEISKPRQGTNKGFSNRRQ